MVAGERPHRGPPSRVVVDVEAAVDEQDALHGVVDPAADGDTAGPS